MNPHEYPVGLDIGLHELRDTMIHQARKRQLENGAMKLIHVAAAALNQTPLALV